MGKKAKTGKQRRDKFYFLAKEAGYRSRAAFKLLQLNKRFEFLQNSRALVDLCAAPGGWLQVAEQNMPISSLRIGVDLVSIKPIKNCITIQGDITEEKTRHLVRKELQTWEADCVLHDGASNIGTNWAHDAFQQNCLTLSALRFATQILRRGGFFVTKIFRSADFQTLIGVFEQLFKKVHVWKPAASRLESAEIFVVCEKYSKPDKVDPALLDVKQVFSMPLEEGDENKTNVHRLLLHPKHKKKPKALGYEEGTELGQYRELGATEFIGSKNSLQLLARASVMVLDSERVAQSEHTTEELRECLTDLKVCGPAEMRLILAWRRKLLAEKKQAEKEEQKRMEIESKTKIGNVDSGIEMLEEEEELAQSNELKELEEIDELIRNAQADEKAKLKKRKKKLLKEKHKMEERKKLHIVHEGNLPMIGEDLELFSLRTIRRIADKARQKAMAAASAVKGEKIEEEDDKEESDEEDEERMEVKENNGKEKMKEINENEEEEEDDDDGLDELDYDEDEDEGGKTQQQKSRKRKLTPEQLAMGEKMIYSKKRARELEDWAWNRHTSNDDDLPEWFEADERKHCRPTQLPIDQSRVAFYAQRDRPLNARSIKKVVEAKQRKKLRKQRRMEKAKKKAEGILDNEQMEQSEKMRELKRLYRKTGTPEKKKLKYQVVTKGKRGSMTRPKGPYKLVDRRLKKDTRSQHHRTKKGSSGGNASARKGRGPKAGGSGRNHPSAKMSNNKGGEKRRGRGK